jgi:hypothetical protein
MCSVYYLPNSSRRGGPLSSAMADLLGEAGLAEPTQPEDQRILSSLRAALVVEVSNTLTHHSFRVCGIVSRSLTCPPQNSKTLLRSQHLQTAHTERLMVHTRLLQHRKAHQATRSALMAVERATRATRDTVPLSQGPSLLEDCWLVGGLLEDVDRSASSYPSRPSLALSSQISTSSNDCQAVSEYKALFNKQLGTIEHESQARCVPASAHVSWHKNSA